MSIKLMSLVFDAEGLTPTHKLVMLALCDYAADDGTSIYPSLRTIARKTALKDPTIRKALRELRDPAGLDLLMVATKNTNRFPNRYAVNVAKLKVISWVLPNNTQTPRVLPNNAQGVTKYPPRGLPDNPDPSLDPPVDPPIKEGISHPDFDRACAYLQETRPADLAAAAPVLLAYDEKPYRMRVKVASMPPDWCATFDQALREANPRRHYRVEFETNGTGRPAPAKPTLDEGQAEADPPDQGEPAPANVTDEQLKIWQDIYSEMTEINAMSGTYRWSEERARIINNVKPARLLSVNGAWTVEVPDLMRWESFGFAFTMKRIYKRNTGQDADFIFVESAK